LIDFPRTVEEITPEWLTQVLRESGAIKDASVESFEVEPIGIGMGFIGTLKRLVLQFDIHEPNAPESVVAKFSPIEESKREFFRTVNTREYQFYPMFGPSVPVDSPRNYFSAMDSGSGASTNMSFLRSSRLSAAA
jgi:hypothetical protein